MPGFISTLGLEGKSDSSLGSLGGSRPDLGAGALWCWASSPGTGGTEPAAALSGAGDAPHKVNTKG